MDTAAMGNPGEIRSLAVSCNHCGASITVSEDTRFVTCQYCGSKLEVQRTGGAAITHVLNDIDQRTQRIEQDVQELKLRDSIEQLDREWMLRQNTFMVRDGNGNYHLPRTNSSGAIVGSVFGAVFGVFWTIMTFSMGAPFPFPLFGLAFIAFAIFGGIVSTSKANAFQNAQDDYQRRRQELMDEMSQR